MSSFYYYCFIELPLVNANSVDPDQTQHYVASDLGLHCLQVTLLCVSRLKWVNGLTCGFLLLWMEIGIEPSTLFHCSFVSVCVSL